MIKVFNTKGYPNLNIVDDKNNLVGFSTDDHCCARGGWFITPMKVDKDFDNHDQNPPMEYPEYVFDESYFEHIPMKDSGDAVRFRLVSPNKEDLYLHLYNCHNGYYSKGFTAKVGGLNLKEKL